MSGINELDTQVRRKVPVVITGVGPVSAIGCGRNDYWNALMEGRHGFAPITLCDVTNSPSKIAAEVKDFDLSKFVADGHLMARRMPRPVQLALAASVLALHDSQLDLDAVDPNRLGVHVGTSLGNIENVVDIVKNLQDKPNVPPAAGFNVFTHSAACILSSFFNIQGAIHTTSSGCNSGLDALGQSARVIQSGAADAMLVVGTDCEVVSEVIATLNSSGALTTKYNEDPGRASRPFDRDRDGNVIGEGAGALLLEAEPMALARRARIYARVAGYQVASAGVNRQYSHDDPELDNSPCIRALSGAMSEAKWKPENVDLINANGSSSKLYDVLEANAFREILKDRFPEVPVHSIKSMLGQHGAGSSALQCITSALTLRRGVVPPTINHENPEPKCGPIRVVTKPENISPKRVLVHAIGFGGFYYSAAALQADELSDAPSTGIISVKWSREQHHRFKPAEEFNKPLEPWKPRME